MKRPSPAATTLEGVERAVLSPPPIPAREAKKKTDRTWGTIGGKEPGQSIRYGHESVYQAHVALMLFLVKRRRVQAARVPPVVSSHSSGYPWRAQQRYTRRRAASLPRPFPALRTTKGRGAAHHTVEQFACAGQAQACYDTFTCMNGRSTIARRLAAARARVGADTARSAPAKLCAVNAAGIKRLAIEEQKRTTGHIKRKSVTRDYNCASGRPVAPPATAAEGLSQRALARGRDFY
ncbi:hypothetical protein EVAR_82305_1 [Eumeta japonica]|uniref:Uncharacterized protein n=1 Tax=Eumeta variegata TaxID=151549 RepID=A0A4C1VZZ8_EUMVA|nr:hypothetical protein EVAR_82305_1 [Eumeta japonica]